MKKPLPWPEPRERTEFRRVTTRLPSTPPNPAPWPVDEEADDTPGTGAVIQLDRARRGAGRTFRSWLWWMGVRK